MKKYKILILFVYLFLFINNSFSGEPNLLERYEDDTPRYEPKDGRKIKKKTSTNYDYQVVRKDEKIYSKEIDSSYSEYSKSTPKNKPYNTKNSYTGIYKIGNPYTVFGKTYYPHEDPNYEEIGMASWYGEEFHNGKTANGETYNMNDYTGAHRTLPLPSVVRVTNLENGKSINIRLNDRGPFKEGRIIDVSKKVANKLDFHEKGLTKVKVKFLEEETEEMLKDLGLK